MDSEIELKLLVDSDADKLLENRFVPELDVRYQHKSDHLFNSYFDTQEQLLRQHGMGLRVRGRNGQYEQTIKTKNGSVGGLHQRLEYNADIPKNQVDLSLFPEEVWRDDLSPDTLNGNLVELFSTHFQRHEYLLHLSDKTDVELVYDNGLIETEKYQCDISEIELELKSGSTRKLFELARSLREVVPFRLGFKSKAQRGYELFLGTQNHDSEASLALENKNMAVAEALKLILSDCLHRMQFNELNYTENHRVKDLVQFSSALADLHRCLQLFSTCFEENQMAGLLNKVMQVREDWLWVEEAAAIKELLSKKGLYRKKLAKHTKVVDLLRAKLDAILVANKPQDLLKHKSYVLMQLELLEFLVCTERLSLVDVEEDAIGKFAKRIYKKELASVQALFFSEPIESIDAFLKRKQKLLTCVQVHHFLDDVVGQKGRDNMEIWLDLWDGIEELYILWMLEQKLIDSDEEAVREVLSWSVEKQRALLKVINLSVNSANKMEV
ncbi:MAG: CYTH domain-containing protein [Alteromonadaceae bacterium]|nr:CYTH domain-containing protein [Alteromonadaceae bacterium]